MESYELLRYVTIGQYVPGRSLIHRLDPRVKISAFLFLALAVTFTVSYTGNAILLVVTVLLVLGAGIPLRYILSGLRPAAPFIAILALLQLLFYGNAYAAYGVANLTLVRWGWIHITTGSIQLVVVSLVRFLVLLFLTSLLTNTTTLTNLTHGIEAMLRPFRRIGFPAHELSLVATVALRFLPLLAEQLEAIMKAQASRGGATGYASRFRFLTSTRRVAALIVPLFIDAFRRAEDLILAMQARCYLGGRGRTSYVRLRSTRQDYLAYASSLLFAIGMVAFRHQFPL